MQFAEEYHRKPGGIGNKGIIIFPNDTVLRRKVLPVHVPHPSKNNLYLYRAICEYGASFGHTVFADPMAGGGSMMYGAQWVANRLYLIELEDAFVDLLHENMGDLEFVKIFKSNCINLLPQLHPVDMIVFSPPYSNQLQSNSGMKIYEHEEGSSGYTGIAEFTKHPDNLSNKKEFFFNIEMEKVFKACYEALSPGGMMCIITKDRIEKGLIVSLALQQVRQCIKAGFKVHLWEQHEHIGRAFGNFNLKQGYRQVIVEDIVFMVKE